MTCKKIARMALVGLMTLLLLAQCLGAIAEADTRWADASDEIDKFLDTAFTGWCAQRGIDPAACGFHDTDNSCWFPKVEEM